MNRQEFVDRLKVSLSGKVSPGQVEENARYYEDYINTRIRLGETEESVMRELGDPRLIARSIVAAESGRTGENGEDQVYGGGEKGNRRRSLLYPPERCLLRRGLGKKEPAGEAAGGSFSACQVCPPGACPCWPGEFCSFFWWYWDCFSAWCCICWPGCGRLWPSP